MEQDRYQQSHGLFITGLISLLFFLTLLAFTIYILPYLLLHWRYDVPDFLIDLRTFISVKYQVPEQSAAHLILLLFGILVVLFGLLAYVSSNHIDNAIYQVPAPSSRIPKMTRGFKESMRLFITLLVIACLIFLGVEAMEWLIS